eukprot:1328089-Pyramimonas_sp.AAC.1
MPLHLPRSNELDWRSFLDGLAGMREMLRPQHCSAAEIPRRRGRDIGQGILLILGHGPDCPNIVGLVGRAGYSVRVGLYPLKFPIAPVPP